MKYGLGSVTGRDTKLGGNWFPCTRFHCIGREIGLEVNVSRAKGQTQISGRWQEHCDTDQKIFT